MTNPTTAPRILFTQPFQTKKPRSCHAKISRFPRAGALFLAKFALAGAMPSSLWNRFQNYFLRYDDSGFSIDISRMKFPDNFFGKMRGKIGKAFVAVRKLEAGAIANPDEKRMVGHYWLRNRASLFASGGKTAEGNRTYNRCGLGRCVSYAA
jgi:hypothetical protein